MEEVDNIVLLTLRQLGANIAPAVKSVKDLAVEEIVEAVAKGLRVIDPSREYSTRLPKEMAARYRVCSTLAGACQQQGFRGELGYHQFLYPSEAETRKLLMWLVEALPKADNRKDEQEALGTGALLQRAIVSALSERINQPWVPGTLLPQGLYRSSSASQSWHYRSARSFRTLHTVSVIIPRGTSDLSTSLPKEVRRYWDAQLPLLSQQPADKRDTAPTIFEEHQRELAAQQEWESEWNKHGLSSGLSKEEYRARKRQKLRARLNESLKGALQRASLDESDALEQLMRTKADMSYLTTSRFSQQTKLATDDSKATAETEEELTQRRQAELQALRDKLAEVTLSTVDLQKATGDLESNIKQLSNRLQDESSKTANLEEDYKLAKEVFDLLDDPDKNIANMKAQIDAYAQRLEELATQWEVRRRQLVQQYRDIKDKRAGRMAASMEKLEKIKEFRRTTKELTEEARERAEYQKQLVEEYERLPKDVQRSQYTDRIMEIVKNVKKQNLEIERVLLDTRALQKEISTLLSTLGRTFAATDELVFKDAKKDEFGKRSYRLLVSIHETCGKLTEIVEETGTLRNAVRDFEDKIDQLTAEKTAQNLAKILSDVDQVRKENADLVATIKKTQLGVA